MAEDPGEVTQLLYELKAGNREAEQRLIPLVYGELHRIATLRLKHEDRNHSLEPTGLVHEAYLRLTKLRDIDWQSRSHFFAISATLMRRILVDYARASHARKRGSRDIRISLNGVEAFVDGPEPEIIALDAALDKLARLDERQSKIVELRFFAGLSEEEAGEILGVSTRTVKRDWRVAKAWLFSELHG